MSLPPALISAMQNPVAPPKDGLLYTPVFRLAFPHLDEPWAGNDPKQNNTPAFSCIGVFSDDANLDQLMRDLNSKLVAKFGPEAIDQIQYGTFRYPLRPKKAMARFSGFEGSGLFMSMRARQEAPPACLHFVDGKPIVLQHGAIERHLYAGAFCYATVNTFAYDNVGKGVSFGLRTLVKVADGEKFGGPKATTQEEALAAITGVALPPGLIPNIGGGPVVEGRAEPPARSVPTTLPAMPIVSGDGADELMEIFNS